MKYLLWIALWIAIPISMVVAEEEKVEYQIGIPHYIAEAYIISDIPDDCLVALEFIAIGEGVAVVPFVTVAEKKFMDSMGKTSPMFQVILEAIICTCEDHKGNRVMVINGLDENGVMQLLWTNPQITKEEISLEQENIVLKNKMVELKIGLADLKDFFAKAKNNLRIEED